MDADALPLMPITSCASCGAKTRALETACPHCSAHPRPRYANALALLCNCASIAIAVTLAMAHPTGAIGATAHAARIREPAQHPAFCGDEQDCLAGSEVAEAITRFISR